MRCQRSLVLVCLTVAVLAAPWTSKVGASAHAADRDPAPSTVLSPEQAAQQDYLRASRDLGISPEEIRTQERGGGEFAQLAARIEARWPQAYVDAQWHGASSASTAIYVRPEVVASAAQLAGSGMASYVRASGGLPLDERAQLETQLVTKAAQASGGQYAVTAEVNPVTATAEITIELPPALALGTTKLAAAISRKIPVPASLHAVTVHLASRTSRLEYGSGGNWNGTRCTAGFTATRNGYPAITGTAHCGGSSYYDGARLSDRWAPIAAKGDVQSMRAAGGVLTNSLRSDWTTWRGIRQVWDPVPGNVVCHFGVTTGHSCSAVTSTKRTAYVPEQPNRLIGNLVFVRGNISKDGDSGGPWFWEDRAHGIHFGTCGTVSCFSAISSLNSIRTAVYKG